MIGPRTIPKNSRLCITGRPVVSLANNCSTKPKYLRVEKPRMLKLFGELITGVHKYPSTKRWLAEVELRPVGQVHRGAIASRSFLFAQQRNLACQKYPI